MSAGDEIHLYDIGTVFRMALTDCGSITDISSVASLQICFLKPDQTVTTKVATTTNIGTDGLMQHTVVDSLFIDQEGCWQWQGIVHFGPTQIWHTNVLAFDVFPNICP